MPINFFNQTCKSESSDTEFGLCDDIPNTKAYIDSSDSTKWIGIVNNPNQKNIEFYAIDNCLNIRNIDGKLESICDGVLKDSSNLIFVELKQKGVKGWFKEGKEQISNTIKLFKANDNLSEYSSVSANVCNSLRPFANSGRAASLQAFKDETGLILRDEQKINI